MRPLYTSSRTLRRGRRSAREPQRLARPCGPSPSGSTRVKLRPYQLGITSGRHKARQQIESGAAPVESREVAKRTPEGASTTTADPRPAENEAAMPNQASNDAVQEAPGSKLPALSGPYRVSVADVEAGLSEGSTIVRLYYPCDDEVPARDAHWLPSWRYAQGYSEYMKIPAVVGVPALTAVAGFSRKPCATDRPLAVQQRGWAADDEGGEVENPLRSTQGTQIPGASVAQPSSALAGMPAPRFPVAIFSHGLAGMRTTYSAICADFASHGYVVAAMEHRDGSACVTWKGDVKIPVRQTTKESEEKDGSMSMRKAQLKQRVCEVRGALELLRRLDSGEDLDCAFTGKQGGVKLTQGHSFKARLDMNSAIMMGHSFGAATSLASCADVLASGGAPATFSACIAFDAWMYAIDEAELIAMAALPGFPPSLFINNQKFQWPTNLNKMTVLQEAWAAANKENKQGHEEKNTCSSQIMAQATMVDAGHMSTSDVQIMFGSLLSLLGDRFKPKVCPRRSLSLNTRVAHSFLKRHGTGMYNSTSAPVDCLFEESSFEATRSKLSPSVLLEVIA